MISNIFMISIACGNPVINSDDPDQLALSGSKLFKRGCRNWKKVCAQCSKQVEYGKFLVLG